MSGNVRRPGWSALACFLASAAILSAQEKSALPEGASARLGMYRLRLPEWIYDTGFTSDDRTLVAIAGDKESRTAVLFDVATGRERKRIALSDSHGVALARTKPVLVVVAAKGFEVWDLATDKLVKAWPHPMMGWKTTALAISPDGTEVVAALSERDRTVLLRWDATTGQALPDRYTAASPLCALSFAADGSQLLTASVDRVVQVNDKYTTVPGTIIAWDRKTGRKSAELATVYPNILFAPDGRRFARGTTGKNVEVIDIGTGQRLAEFGAPHGTFAFTPDSKQFLLVYGGQLRLWDIEAGKDVRPFEDVYQSSNGRPRFSADGRLLAMVNVKHVQFWDVASGKRFRFATGHPGAVNGLAFSPDGHRLATFSEDMLLIYDVRTGVELRRWVGHEKAISQVAFSPDGKLLASASWGGTVAIWDSASVRLRHRLDVKAYGRALAFSRDGASLTLIAIGSHRSLQSWDVEKGVLQHSHELPPQTILPSIAQSGQLLASFAELRGATLQLMNARTGKSMPDIDLRRRADGEFEGGLTSRAALAVSGDGRLIATSDGGRFNDYAIRVWETVTRKEVLRLAGLPNGTSLLAISPDGRLLAHGLDTAFTWSGHGSDATVILRDIATGGSVYLQPAEGSVDVRFKDAEAFRKRHRSIGGDQASITCLAFSPDGKFLATGGSDQVVHLWRVADFLERPKLPEVRDDVTAFWPRLADANPVAAYQAIAQLERTPQQAVSLLRKHLRPVTSADAQVIAGHLRDLASDNFKVRRQAYAALDNAGEQAAHFFQDALRNPGDLEVKRRLEKLLDKLDRPPDDPGQIRVHRCLVLLERIATPEARQLLTDLSQGAPAAWLTTEARHSLARLARTPTP